MGNKVISRSLRGKRAGVKGLMIERGGGGLLMSGRKS